MWASLGCVGNAEVTHAEIPYINDEHADAATKDTGLKLVFRLLEFTILAEGMLRVIPDVFS